MNHPRNLTAPKRPEKWCLEDNPFLLSFPGRIVAFPGCIYFKSSDHFPPIHGIAPVGTTYSGLRPSHDCMVSLLANWDLAMNNDAQSLSCSSSFYLFFLILSYTNRSLDFTYWKEKESSESGSTRNEPSNVCWLAAVAASLGIWTLPGYTGALRKQILHMDRGEPYKKMILSSQIWHAEGLYNLGTSGM